MRASVNAAIIVVGLTGWLIFSDRLAWSELAAFDILFEVRGSRLPSAQVVIVGIGQETFDELGEAWPLPRAMHARLIEILNAHAPLVIGLDLIFAGPSSRGPDDDQALISALRRNSNVILATTGNVSPGERLSFSRVLPELESAAFAVGSARALLDRDGVVRNALIQDYSRGVPVLSLGAQIHRRVAPALGGSKSPERASDLITINFAGGAQTYLWVPYQKIIQGRFSRDLIEGKIVLVGSIDPLQHDFFVTPFAPQRQMPGVEIQANIIATLLKGNEIRQIPTIVSTIAAMAAVVVTIGFGLWSFRRLIVGSIVLLILACAGTISAFIWGDIWFRGIGVIFGIMLGLVTSLILIAYNCEHVARKHVEEA